MGSAAHAVHVVATTDEGTRRALAEATRLSAGQAARVLLLVPRVVSFSEPSHEDAVALASRYRALAAAEGVDAVVRLCVCRRLDDVFRELLAPHASVVIGGSRGRWWPTRSERIARRLRDEGHDVTYAVI